MNESDNSRLLKVNNDYVDASSRKSPSDITCHDFDEGYKTKTNLIEEYIDVDEMPAAKKKTKKPKENAGATKAKFKLKPKKRPKK